jgi:hypothetical protein
VSSRCAGGQEAERRRLRLIPFLMEYRSQDACRCVPDELKPDCNQSLRLITDRRPSLTVRLHGQVCSEPDVVSFHRADWSTWPGGRAKGGEERCQFL